LYFGTRASLIVTRFNQTVDNLIASAIVDSIEGLPEWENIFGGRFFLQQAENLNLGSVRNQGWEVQGGLNVGPVVMKGTYSWTKSRIIGITPKYRSQFPQYVRGGVFRLFPEHTFAVNAQYTRARSTISINVQGQGQLFTGATSLFYTNTYKRFSALSPRIGLPSTYVGVLSGYALADFNAAQYFSPRLEGIFQIQNLGNFYRNDQDATFANIGRQTKAGLRLRF